MLHCFVSKTHSPPPQLCRVQKRHCVFCLACRLEYWRLFWSDPRLCVITTAPCCRLTDPNNQSYLASPLFRLPFNNKMASYGATPSGDAWKEGGKDDLVAVAAATAGASGIY